MANMVINLRNKFSQFSEYWSPRIIAQMNDYQFKLVKIKGEFVWHSHAETDETFIVLEGEMKVGLPDGEVELKAGEMMVVPKGLKHKPLAENECHIMLVEPNGVINTGDTINELTIEGEIWL